MWLWLIILIVVVPMIYVRLSSSDPARWHKRFEPAGVETQKLGNGYVWRQVIEEDGKDKLKSLDAVARATLRTSHLAGSVEEGQITYVTRSLVYGFPDHTTIGVYDAPDGQRYLEIYARLRYGRSDLGVNAKRVKGWLAAVQ